MMRFFHNTMETFDSHRFFGALFKTKYGIFLQKTSGESGVLEEMGKQVDTSGMTPLICACHAYSLWNVSWENCLLGLLSELLGIDRI